MAKYLEVEPIENSICNSCKHRVSRLIQVPSLSYLTDIGILEIEGADEEEEVEEEYKIKIHFCKETLSDIFGSVLECTGFSKRTLEQHLKEFE